MEMPSYVTFGEFTDYVWDEDGKKHILDGVPGMGKGWGCNCDDGTGLQKFGLCFVGTFNHTVEYLMILAFIFLMREE